MKNIYFFLRRMEWMLDHWNGMQNSWLIYSFQALLFHAEEGKIAVGKNTQCSLALVEKGFLKVVIK